MLQPWDNPRPLTRCWCLWELLCTIRAEKRLEVVLGAEQEALFLAALRDRFDHVMKALCQVDVRNADAYSADDKRAIMLAVESSVGFSAARGVLV